MSAQTTNSSNASSSTTGGQDPTYLHKLHLYQALDGGNWEAAKRLLQDNPAAVTASLTPAGDTALHVAVLARHKEIVERLVSEFIHSKDDLLIKNKMTGATALNHAAISGSMRIVRCLAVRAPELHGVANNAGHLPVVMGAVHGHKKVVRYLYGACPKDELVRLDGAFFLTSCILIGLYDVALDLLDHYPQLAFARNSQPEIKADSENGSPEKQAGQKEAGVQYSDYDTALDVLAQSPSAFPSGVTLGFWHRWIYSRIPAPQISFTGIDEEDSNRQDIQAHQVSFSGVNAQVDIDIERTLVGQAIDKWLVVLSQLIRYPGFKHLYHLKWSHVAAQKLLVRLSEGLSTLPGSEFEPGGSVYKALFQAVSYGNPEVVSEIINHYPYLVWARDGKRRGIFLRAARHRQEKVFSLIYKMGAKKNTMAKYSDDDDNTMLHQAAFLAPPWRLNHVRGAALQVQRELQWYNEVASIVQPRCKEMKNASKTTPWELFTESHKELVKKGEEWMKSTATSCTVMAALIATIMFAVLFTVPGGFEQSTGLPVYLRRNLFLVFVVSDAVSLFASSTSMLMFLGVLTSRYWEGDFLRSLPKKMIVGLSMLLVSMGTMMITFGVSLVMFLKERFHWVAIPIMVLAAVPVMIFARLQIPLLVDIFWSTYGPGIFDKPSKKKKNHHRKS